MKPRADRPLRALAMLLAMLLAPLHGPLALAQGAARRYSVGSGGPGTLQGAVSGQLPGHQRRRARDFTAPRHGAGPVAVRIARLSQPPRPRRGEPRRPAAQHHGCRTAAPCARSRSSSTTAAIQGSKDVRMTFDWPQGRVRGESKGKPFDLPVQPGTQDSTSVQVAMLLELVAGTSRSRFASRTARGSRSTATGRRDAQRWSRRSENSRR